MKTFVDVIPIDGLPIYDKTDAVTSWFMMDAQFRLCEMKFKKILVPLFDITTEVMTGIASVMREAEDRGCSKSVLLMRKDNKVGLVSMDLLPFVYLQGGEACL